jgi:hypothetical protein
MLRRTVFFTFLGMVLAAGNAVSAETKRPTGPVMMDAVVNPILKSSALVTDAEVTKKYGVRTETTVIHSDGKR